VTPKEAATAVIQTSFSDGWAKVIVPGLERRKQGLIQEILQAPDKAPAAQAAGIQVIDYILKLPSQAVATLKEIEEGEKHLEEAAAPRAAGSPYDE